MSADSANTAGAIMTAGVMVYIGLLFNGCTMNSRPDKCAGVESELRQINSKLQAMEFRQQFKP